MNGETMQTHKVISFIFIWLSINLLSCNQSKPEIELLPDLPTGVEAITLLGDTLYTPEPVSLDSRSLQNYTQAKRAYETDPNNPDNIIWYGRRTAYLGKYREAIKIYSEGIKKFPEDARIYRHRGHRFISIREYDRAIQDFDHAAKLIKGTEDKIEPDGNPNPKNIPLTTTHRNIWYHLGLAYYLKNDMENAIRINKRCLAEARYDDNVVSTTHWLYMSFMRLGKKKEAQKLLEPIHANMELIENMYYHRLCLFYKGKLAVEELIGENRSDMMNDGIAYGLANWYLNNDDRDKAKEIYLGILKPNLSSSFGYLAAEADYVREFLK